MADLSKIKLNGTNYNLKDAIARPLVIDAEWLGKDWELDHDRIGKCFSLSVNFDEFQTAVAENKRIILRFYNNTGNNNFYFGNDYYPYKFFNINVDLLYYQNTTELYASFAGFADILGQWFTIYITYSDNTTGDLEINYQDYIVMHNNIPSNLSSFYNDVGYLTSYTETDPTVPAWAKAVNKPSYTASEVGATTTSDVNNLIASALGNVSAFQIDIVQNLPATGINGTFYFVPSTAAGTNNIYNEYVYVNGAWELIGSTEVDLTNYLQVSDIAAWAKAANKPNYTASEVGALPSNTTYVTSVNGNSGIVTVPIYDDTALAARVTALESIPWVTYYSGTADPNNNNGENGDLYLQTLE